MILSTNIMLHRSNLYVTEYLKTRLKAALILLRYKVSLQAIITRSQAVDRNRIVDRLPHSKLSDCCISSCFRDIEP